jgi:hypothetical protein
MFPKHHCKFGTDLNFFLFHPSTKKPQKCHHGNILCQPLAFHSRRLFRWRWLLLYPAGRHGHSVDITSRHWHLT